MDLNAIFNDIPVDLIKIIALDTKDRKQLHQYLEIYYPDLKKVSLKSKYFRGERIGTYIKCYECDYKRVPLNNYHEGYMSNNKDEWRSGECPRCGEHISWEPNYDDWDEVTLIHSNNIIAFGPWFKHYNKPNHAEKGEISEDTIINILKNKKIYEIPAPGHMSKRNITKYIDEELQKLM